MSRTIMPLVCLVWLALAIPLPSSFHFACVPAIQRWHVELRVEFGWGSGGSWGTRADLVVCPTWLQAVELQLYSSAAAFAPGSASTTDTAITRILSFDGKVSVCAPAGRSIAYAKRYE